MKDNVARGRFPLITLVAIAFGAGAWLGSLLDGGLLQLLLCLVALAIFGQSVEDALGRVRYVLVMLAGALVALAVQVAAGQGHGFVTLSCVGAVAAVLAAHIALHPRARVHSVLFAPLFSTILAIPTLALIAVWTALQVTLAVQ